MKRDMKSYRLTANKTKMYKLAQRRFPDIPPMRKTEFVKYRGVRDYALTFTVDYALTIKLFLSVCCGAPRLGITRMWWDDDGETHEAWESNALTPAECHELGLLEEIA